MLDQRITEDMKKAMKAGNKEALSAIRMLKSAIKDRQIELRRDMEDEEVLALIGKLVKQRREAARQYAEAGRADLEAKELREADVYIAYLPEPLSETELAAMLDTVLAETGAASLKDMGKVMAVLKENYAGQIDMGKAGPTVRERLA